MRKLSLIIVIALIAIMKIGAQDLTGKSVLIYSFVGEGYVHENIAASVKALEEICASVGVNTEHADDPSVFQRRGLSDFDAIIFTNTNTEAFLKGRQKSKFKEFIESGKGFMGIHGAAGSEPEWMWFVNMIGGRFVRHPKLQSFDIKVIDGQHISATHLPETWSWEDECYFFEYLNPAINVLLAADLTTVTDNKTDAYHPGKIFGDLTPLAWYHNFNGSRVFYTALGHKKEYYGDPDFRNHLEGGIKYILGMD